MRKTVSLGAALLLGACKLGPDYKPAALPPASTGAFQIAAPGTAADAPADDWWRVYQDPALDALVRQALAANTDLRVARANLTRALGELGEARAARLPTTADLTGSARYGDDGGFQGGGGQGGGGQGGGGQGGSVAGGAARQWSYTGNLNVEWEMDLFGRIGRTIEAYRADAQAVEAARNRVAITVAAETTRAYADACALGESIQVARDSIGIAERQVTLQRTRERSGAASKLDIERVATLAANIQAALPALEARRQASLFELAALLGQPPAGVPEAARACVRAPAPVAQIPVGDGHALLARRPDVREAERRLAAATARIGVATADLFPRISLGGSGNFFRNDQVRGADSFSFSVGPLISWSLPNLVTGRARIRQAEAGMQASLATFDGAVLTALKEVEQALATYAGEGRRNERLREAADHAAEAYRLAQLRQRAGSISLLELLDTQRELLDARAAFASSSQQLGSYRVDLFKALGGGWQTPQAAGEPDWDLYGNLRNPNYLAPKQIFD